MITIVSGLPRSGTSMIMQMLEKGGMEILTDNIRKADESNPRGYYEFEKAKSLRSDCSWLVGADGKAIKIIAQLLRFLPADYCYAIIFIERDMQEILLSQQHMLATIGQESSTDPDLLMQTFSRQLESAKAWVAGNDNMRSCNVSYHDLIQHPAAGADRINDFLADKLDARKMAAAVDQTLYRQRLQPIEKENLNG